MEEEEAKYLSAINWGIFADAFKYSKETKSIPPDRSLKDFFVGQVEQKDLTVAQRKIVLQMSEMLGAFVGSAHDRQSLKFFWLEECIDGGESSHSSGIGIRFQESMLRSPSSHYRHVHLCICYYKWEQPDACQKISSPQRPTKQSWTAYQKPPSPKPLSTFPRELTPSIRKRPKASNLV